MKLALTPNVIEEELSPVWAAGVETERRRLSGEILQAVAELLDANGIPYCILYGYEEYPSQVDSDVDCLVPVEFLSGQLAKLFRTNRGLLGAAVVQWVQYESKGRTPLRGPPVGAMRFVRIAT